MKRSMRGIHEELKVLPKFSWKVRVYCIVLKSLWITVWEEMWKVQTGTFMKIVRKFCFGTFKKGRKNLEMPGFDPSASRMLSERSTN